MDFKASNSCSLIGKRDYGVDLGCNREEVTGRHTHAIFHSFDEENKENSCSQKKREGTRGEWRRYCTASLDWRLISLFSKMLAFHTSGRQLSNATKEKTINSSGHDKEKARTFSPA